MSPGPTWWRYGSQYRRLCARAGCGAPAVATLRFQSTERQAWLVELDDNAARTQGDLCQRHAAALVLPRGWDLHDERLSAAPAAVAEVAPEAEPKPTKSKGQRRVRVKKKEPAAQKVEPAETEPTPDAGEIEGEGDAESNGTGSRAPLVPLGEGDDDEVDEALDAVLDARTPLLQRAFRNARPTDSSADPDPASDPG